MTTQILREEHSNQGQGKAAIVRLEWVVRTVRWRTKIDLNKDRIHICHKSKVVAKIFTISY